MTKRKSIALILILTFMTGILVSCGSPAQQAEPKEFSPDLLEWGMSQQDVLDVFSLSNAIVRTESIEDPASETVAARTVTKMTYDNFVFEGLPFRATFTFTEYHAASEWDIGLTAICLEILEDSVRPFTNLKNAFSQSHLETIIRWDEISEQEREKMHQFYFDVFPKNTTVEDIEMIHLGVAGGGRVCHVQTLKVFIMPMISTTTMLVSIISMQRMRNKPL